MTQLARLNPWPPPVALGLFAMLCAGCARADPRATGREYRVACRSQEQ